MGLVKIISFLLVFCFIGLVVSMFIVRILAWFLSRLMPVSVEFEISGCNSLRDVNLKFRKGYIDTVFIGEVKLTLGRSLIKMWSTFVYSRPKLQLLICDIEVVIKKSEASIKEKKSQRSNSRRKGKLLLTISNIARFLSVCIKDIVVKVPKAIIEVKELRWDVLKDSGAEPFFNFCLHLMPLLVQLDPPEFSFSQSSDCRQTDDLIAGKEYFSILENNPAPIICDKISFACEFGYERERLTIWALDVSTGDITADLNEGLFLRTDAKLKSSADTDAVDGAIQDNSITKISKKKFPLESIKKSLFVFPEKASFSMAKVDVEFTHRGEDLSFHNCILGINLSSSKSKSTEDIEEDASQIVLQLDLNEIHLLKGGEASVMEMLKLSFNASVDAPMQENKPIKVGANMKVGATHCNLLLKRLSRFLKLRSSAKKKMVLHEETFSQEKSQATERKDIMWTCAVSTSEVTILIYCLNELPLYHGYCQSCNFSANNVATREILVHTELSELFLVMDNGRKAQVKQNLLEEKSSGSLMNIKRLNIDWGSKNFQTREIDNFPNWKLALSIDVIGMGVFIGFQQIETLMSTMMAYKILLKGPSSSKQNITQSKMPRSSKIPAKGIQIMKVKIDSCMIMLNGDITVEDAIVADPKRVNFGSQGGQVVINESSDGTPRTATILSTLPSCCNHVNFRTSVEVVRLSLCINKEKESTQIGLERAISIYQEFVDEEKKGDKITIFEIHKTKFFRRTSGMTDAIRSLFSAADIAIRWEPDVHLALYEFAMRLTFLVQNNKLQDAASDLNEPSLPVEVTIPAEVLIDTVQSEKKNPKRDSCFAVDVENIRISAELADGVEAMIHGSSIFSENARIGILLEGFLISFNDARVLKSGRLQISSVPISTCTSIDAILQYPATRDWIIQGFDVHVCLPYRLQLRAIDDAVEEMFRGLNLVTTALSTVIFPIRKDGSIKRKSGTAKVGSLRVILGRLTADIEEEPMQGWLDEHYYLLKKEVCELNARLKFLDEFISAKGISVGTEQNVQCAERKIHYNGLEINVGDISSVQLLREEIYRQVFKSYYQACQKIDLSHGSGACSTGFQSGFKSSKVRSSLLSISVTDFDVNLTKIKGGIHGMIEFINKVDPFCLENDIPFSRLYGTDFLLNSGSLLVQLRNYSFPIFSGNSGKCHGRIVLAQQVLL